MSKKEFFADKFIDLIFMFFGLYAAIWVQNYADDQEEHQQYKQLLMGFSEELSSNQAQRQTVEKQLGKLEDAEQIGEASLRFEFFNKKADYYRNFLSCYLDRKKAQVAQFKKTVSATRLKECKKSMKKLKDKDPNHLSLSPVYRRDVWRFYLAGGVHLFQEFESKSNTERCNLDGVSVNGLAICIGSTYGKLGDIEDQVKHIQDLVNDTYFRKQGAMQTRFKKFMQEMRFYRKRKDAEAIIVMEKLIKNFISYIEELQYAVDQSANIMKYKVQVLKKDMLKLDQRFKVVRNSIQREIEL